MHARLRWSIDSFGSYVVSQRCNTKRLPLCYNICDNTGNKSAKINLPSINHPCFCLGNRLKKSSRENINCSNKSFSGWTACIFYWFLNIKKLSRCNFSITNETKITVSSSLCCKSSQKNFCSVINCFYEFASEVIRIPELSLFIINIYFLNYSANE